MPVVLLKSGDHKSDEIGPIGATAGGGEAEIPGEASAGEPLEELAITVKDRPQPLAEHLVLSAARDALSDRLAHRIRDAVPPAPAPESSRT